jgi:hypothetical protein
MLPRGWPRAASAAVLIVVTCAVCSTVAAVMMMNHVVAWEKNIPTALSVRMSRIDRLVLRPRFSSTSCEVRRVHREGGLADPGHPVSLREVRWIPVPGH